jgi:hypothetical protein
MEGGSKRYAVLPTYGKELVGWLSELSEFI